MKQRASQERVSPKQTPYTHPPPPHRERAVRSKDPGSYKKYKLHHQGKCNLIWKRKDQPSPWPDFGWQTAWWQTAWQKCIETKSSIYIYYKLPAWKVEQWNFLDVDSVLLWTASWCTDVQLHSGLGWVACVIRGVNLPAFVFGSSVPSLNYLTLVAFDSLTKNKTVCAVYRFCPLNHIIFFLGLFFLCVFSYEHSVLSSEHARQFWNWFDI